MASKDELQNALKENYGINKNISQSLTKEECQRLLDLLALEPGLAKLVESFAEKNSSLWHNNAHYGRMRSKAEKQLEAAKAKYLELEESIQTLATSTAGLEVRKQQLEQEREQLKSDIQNLSHENRSLAVEVNNLTSKNSDLTQANEQLKRDNKDLKNIVDQIRLRLARDTKLLLQYEDSEIRKALIRLFRWTLG